MSRGALAFCIALLVVTSQGCAQLRPYRTPAGIERWQDPAPPQLSLAEKARRYQDRLEKRHQFADGVIRYKRLDGQAGPASGYGNLSDGSFFLGIYLASQALRYAVTRDAEARQQILLSLHAMDLYADASGKRGLLARYLSPVKPEGDARWRPSPTLPGYFWRPDVSKDQVAGFIHGLGVTLAVVDDPQIRARVGALAAALADHLIDNDLRLIDWDGKRTTHGNLRGRILGFPVAVNALIALCVARTAASGTGEARYAQFHRGLIGRGYGRLARWLNPLPIGKTSRDNEHMAYLALYPLLLLEQEPDRVAELQRAGRAAWHKVREDRNAFFAFVHAALVEAPEAAQAEGNHLSAAIRGKAALLEFPEEKRGWPVDLTRPGFDFERRFRKSSRGHPRAAQSVPLYLRPGSSSLWTSDPYRLVGRLHNRGEIEFAGIDYLIAYWMGRYHGFVAPED